MKAGTSYHQQSNKEREMNRKLGVTMAAVMMLAGTTGFAFADSTAPAKGAPSAENNGAAAPGVTQGGRTGTTINKAPCQTSKMGNTEVTPGAPAAENAGGKGC
jgi:hypothetical protein